MRRSPALAVAGLLIVATAACTDDPGPVNQSPTAPPSATPTAAASQAAVPVQTRTVDAAGDILLMSVGPLIRSGDSVVLTVQTRLERPGGDAAAAVVSRHFSTTLSTSFDSARLVDDAAGQVYLVSRTLAGSGCVCTGLLRLGAGETRPLQAVFRGVPAGVDRLSVMLPYAGVFTDIPVLAGDVPAPPSGGSVTGRAQEPLDLATAAPAFTAALESYTERLDVALRTRRSADRVDISLDTDVLFRLDSAELTPAAGRSIAALVADLRAAGPGPLTITGHTDSSGTAAHNRTLSQQRAVAVADALRGRLPDADWPKTVAARGESEPAVPNDTAAHRALNRRVTVSHPARAQSPAPAAVPPETSAGATVPKIAAAGATVPNTAAGTTVPNTAAGAAVLPKTKGQQGRAPDGVEVALPLNRGTIRFIPGPATRHGSFLLVSLIARNVGERKATILDFLGQGVFTVRDEFDPFARYGTSGVRMLQGGTAAYGLDYEIAPGDHRCLCDRILNQAIPPGGDQVLSLWFPAPPAGAGTVTLDVPDRLRITDIPVS